MAVQPRPQHSCQGAEASVLCAVPCWRLLERHDDFSGWLHAACIAPATPCFLAWRAHLSLLLTDSQAYCVAAAAVCVCVRVCACALTVQQVAFADKILLNKTDLVAAADKANVVKRIRVRRHRAQA